MHGESATQRTIFLIEEDSETLPVLRKNLERRGYRVLVAVDEQDAVDRTEGGVLPADMVLVNLVGKSADEAMTVGRRVRECAKYDGRTPVVVIAEKYDTDLEGQDVNVGGNDWIVYLGEESGQLQSLIARLVA